MDNKITMQDLLTAYMGIAHDVSAVAYQIAKADPKFAAMDAQQQSSTTAWYASKLLMMALERLGILTETPVNETKVRQMIYELQDELAKENK